MSLFKDSKKDFNCLNHVNIQPSLLILSPYLLAPHRLRCHHLRRTSCATWLRARKKNRRGGYFAWAAPARAADRGRQFENAQRFVAGGLAGAEAQREYSFGDRFARGGSSGGDCLDGGVGGFNEGAGWGWLWGERGKSCGDGVGEGREAVMREG